MKKTLLIFTSTLLIIAGLAYTLLFTHTGNDLLKPSIQAKINEHSPLPITLEYFSLSPSKIRLLLQMDQENSILFEGTYSLFSQEFDIDYDIRLTKLSNLNVSTQRELHGKLLSDGKVQGNPELFKIKGKSDIALSKTEYAIVIKRQSLDKAAIKLSSLDIATLLAMLGEKAYSKGKLDLHVQLNELDPLHMQGNIVLNIKQARLNPKTIKEELGITLSKSSLKADFSATLKDNHINYITKLDSELAKVYSKGKIETGIQKIDADYTIDIKELSLLKSLTGTPLYGAFYTQGLLNGDKKSLLVNGKSNIVGSDTSYEVTLIDFKPSQLNFKTTNASLKKLLYLAGEPAYADGKLNLTATLKSVVPAEGKLLVKIDNGIVHAQQVKKSFDINLPYTTFDLHSNADIVKEAVTANTVLNSNIATLNMKNTHYDIIDTSLVSNYELYIPSLQRLEPVVDRKLYGELKAKGEIHKEKKLTLTMHSDIFKGRLDGKMVDEKIDLAFQELHALEVLQMLGYPKVIDAPVNGTLIYNTKTKQGKLESRFEKAKLQRSQMTELVNRLAHTDLTREHFNEGSLVSLIDDKIITSDLKMKSKSASLKSKKFIINSKKQLIDARFALQIKKYPGDIIVAGDINSPKVKLDAKSMVTPEIKDKVGKEINRFLKKLF